tara:strand:+ start:3770 stop:4684 length:915 start_codon:yes stop_codon:yes gene_type:complete
MNTIIHPLTNEQISLYSKGGKALLKQFISSYNAIKKGGGELKTMAQCLEVPCNKKVWFRRKICVDIDNQPNGREKDIIIKKLGEDYTECKEQQQQQEQQQKEKQLLQQKENDKQTYEKVLTQLNNNALNLFKNFEIDVLDSSNFIIFRDSGGWSQELSDYPKNFFDSEIKPDKYTHWYNYGRHNYWVTYAVFLKWKENKNMNDIFPSKTPLEDIPGWKEREVKSESNFFSYLFKEKESNILPITIDDLQTANKELESKINTLSTDSVLKEDLDIFFKDLQTFKNKLNSFLLPKKNIDRNNATWL